MNSFLGTITGNDSNPGYNQEWKKAVADRFIVILPLLKQKHGDYIYTGNRCLPENIGWRMSQSLHLRGRDIPNIDLIHSGVADSDISDAWTDAASAEHWYTHEKDWGFEPGCGPLGGDY